MSRVPTGFQPLRAFADSFETGSYGTAEFKIHRPRGAGGHEYDSGKQENYSYAFKIIHGLLLNFL
jgi:hypothetical protein